MALSRRKVGVGETARCLCLGERSVGEASRCVMMTMQRRTVSLKQTDALWWRVTANPELRDTRWSGLILKFCMSMWPSSYVLHWLDET